MHNRNVYGLSSVDRVFVLFDQKPIVGLNELISTHFPETKPSILNLTEDEDIKPIDIITASYIADKLKAEDNSHNLTIFYKKDPFYKSEVGKLSIVTAASFLIIGAYPIYQQYQITTNSIENSKLQERLDTLSASNKKLKVQDRKIKTEIKRLKDELKIVDEKFAKLRNISNSLLALKSKDAKYTPMLLTINDLLKEYKLSLGEVSQEGRATLDLEIYSLDNKRDNIAKFMNALLKRGFRSVSSNEIVQEENSYKSIIRIQK
jgi:predicted transcriptional regulator